jgi:hypothetical protein
MDYTSVIRGVTKKLEGETYVLGILNKITGEFEMASGGLLNSLKGDPGFESVIKKGLSQTYIVPDLEEPWLGNSKTKRGRFQQSLRHLAHFLFSGDVPKHFFNNLREFQITHSRESLKKILDPLIAQGHFFFFFCTFSFLFVLFFSFRLFFRALFQFLGYAKQEGNTVEITNSKNFDPKRIYGLTGSEKMENVNETVDKDTDLFQGYVSIIHFI